MKKYQTILSVIFLINVVLGSSVYAQEKEEPEERLTRILLVLDASGSMNARWESDIKFEVATKILGRILDSLDQFDNLEVGLRIMGTKRLEIKMTAMIRS